MIATTKTGKVYYLPAAEPVEAAPPVWRGASLRRRLRRGWWRVRLSLADFRVSVWGLRRRRRDDYTALLRGVVEDSPAELIDRRRRKPSRPATILDFQAARFRLRPETS
jgi:hypothetical protein